MAVGPITAFIESKRHIGSYIVKATSKVVLAAVVAMLSSTALADDPIGLIKRSKGDVRIERSGEHIPAARGTLIQRGDRVITGSNGYASVTMRRTSPITLGPGNDVVLDRYAADEIPSVTRPAPPILQGLASFLAVNRQR